MLKLWKCDNVGDECCQNMLISEQVVLSDVCYLLLTTAHR